MSDRSMRGRVWPRMLSLLLLLAVVAALVVGWNDYRRFSVTPLNVTVGPPSLDVSRGTSFKGIVAELHKQGLSKANPWYWRLLAEQMHVAGKLHAGEYELKPGLTPRQLLANMAEGKVLQRNFTIVDGWTFNELRQALTMAPQLKHDSEGLDDATIMRRIGAGGEAPEGRFLPETYAYVKGDGDLDVLKRAHLAMVSTLTALWPGRDKDLPLTTPYDALILASIVEKETGRADERARIAGVFVRRLRDHMLLQTDPSVIYGMGARYDG
ncbi:MAG: endolytic transglycosylase MltG, partial [Rhodanobacter sp.]